MADNCLIKEDILADCEEAILLQRNLRLAVRV